MLNFILRTPRVNMLSNVIVVLWSGAYLWLFVETSHEMYFTETSKWINKTSNFKEFSRLILAIIYGCLSFFYSFEWFPSSSGHELSSRGSSRRLRNLIICHNFLRRTLCGTVLDWAFYTYFSEATGLFSWYSNSASALGGLMMMTYCWDYLSLYHPFQIYYKVCQVLL